MDWERCVKRVEIEKFFKLKYEGNMIRIEETDSESPKCPHCEDTLTKIMARRIESNLGVRFVYFCSKCKRVLGVSHRKGFWMG